MAVDIGGGTTGVAGVSLGSIVTRGPIPVAITRRSRAGPPAVVRCVAVGTGMCVGEIESLRRVFAVST
ncbi:actin-like ATPase involved in cell morphogenesis [Kitasatospora sp. GP82]|nr:actin-like ATPase involved in cell morphogenesis [Kitasatospora sp. GP82]